MHKYWPTFSPPFFCFTSRVITIQNMYENNEVFRKELEAKLSLFKIFLKENLKPRTIHRHVVVISNLIDYLCFDWGVSDYHQIRRGMVCSHFRRWYCSNIADLTESQVNTSVKKFFSFLLNEQNISVNEDVLKGLNIKT